MEVEELEEEQEDQVSLAEEEGKFDLDLDPNDFYPPKQEEVLLEVENLASLTLEKIKKLIFRHWEIKNNPKAHREFRDPLETAFQNLGRKTILVPNPLEESPREIYFEKNQMADNDNDYEKEKEADLEEAIRLKNLDDNAAIIHIDVRRAFDNIAPKTLAKLLEKMADSEQFKILRPFKNLIKKWGITSASEQIKIEGYEEFRRTYGEPQGSLWTPAIWNLYLTTILKNSPLRKMIRVYADNIFIWIDGAKVSETYVKKVLDLAKKILQLANLELNEDEIFVYWRGVKPEYVAVFSKVVRLPERQKILGFNFKLEKGQWKYQIKFWLPLSPKRSLIGLPFKQRIIAFKAKALGSLYYQIQGWYIFGDPKDHYDWQQVNKYIRAAYINWTGMQKISMMDLASMGMLLRPYLMDRISEAFCTWYDRDKKLLTKKANQGNAPIVQAIKDALKIKYIPEQDNERTKAVKLQKLGSNFAMKIASDSTQFKSWATELITQIDAMKWQDEKYKSAYWSHFGGDLLSDGEKIANYQMKYSLRRRVNDQYAFNLDHEVRWRNRAFWHICMQKECNRREAEDLSTFIKQTLARDGTWTQIIGRLLEVELTDKMAKETKVKDFIQKHEWDILDEIYQVMDAPLSGNLEWRRTQILRICHTYDMGEDKRYIDFFQNKVTNA